MIRIKNRRHAWMTLALLVLLGTALASPAQAQGAEKGRWIKVEVTESGEGGPKVKVNLPLSLVEGMLDAVEFTDPSGEVTVAKGIVVVEGNRIDLRKLIDELKKLPPTEFVTVEDGAATVKIWIE